MLASLTSGFLRIVIRLLNGSVNHFYDWMEANNINSNPVQKRDYDNIFFQKVVDVSRLKNLCELTVDEGVIFFETKGSGYNDQVQKFLEMGLSYANACSQAGIINSHAIIVNNSHRHLKLLENVQMNKYFPKSLKEVVSIWDGIKLKQKQLRPV